MRHAFWWCGFSMAPAGRGVQASKVIWVSLLAGLTALALLLPISTASAEQVLRILTYKNPDRIDVVVRVFEGMYDVRVELVHEKTPAPETLKTSQAGEAFDVLLSHDATMLEKARLAGATTPISSAAVLSSARGQLLGPDGHWISTSMHARAFVVAKDRVAEPPRSYDDLADPRWRGKLCVRSAEHPYNLGLIGAMIAHAGEFGAEEWLRAVKANLARRPTGGDRDQLRAVAAGECDLALVNTYYLVAPHTAQRTDEERAWERQFAVVLPNVPARNATHVNTTGVALLNGARNRKAAEQFVAFMVDPQTQGLMSSVYGEYPVTPDDTIPALHRFGALNPDPLSISRLTELTDAARAIADRVQFDDGPAH